MSRKSRGAPPSAGPVSIASVAARAGVSIATVSRVMNGVRNRAGAETVRRVREAAGALGYRPQSVGRALRNKESRIVGLLAANLGNPAMAAIAASIENALRGANYVMALCDTHERPEIQDEYLREMEAQLARAIVIAVAVPSSKLEELSASGKPLVFVGRRDPLGRSTAFVGIDDYRAGQEIGRLCGQAGVGAPAIIHASLEFSAGKLRRDGVVDGAAKAGIQKRLIRGFTSPGLDHLEIGYRAMTKLLATSPPPRVVVALSDLLAYGAYRKAIEAGLRVPDDVAFVSFDDNPLNKWIAPWLNAAGIPCEHYGEAVLALIEQGQQCDEPGERLLPFRLSLRTAPFVRPAPV